MTDSEGHMDDQETKALSPNEKIVEAPPGRMTGPLFMAMAAAAFGSSFQFGYNIGVVNPPKPKIVDWINGSCVNFSDTPDDCWLKNQANVAFTFIVSVWVVGGMCGGMLSGIFADKFGRKGGMLLNNAFAFAGAALQGLSKTSGTYYVLIIGRFVCGFNCGLNSGLAPIYLTEISPVNLRGTLGTVHQLVVTISILIAMVLGLEQVLGTADSWPWLFAFTAVPALFQICILPFCPESPKHDFINRDNREQAEATLIKLRQTDQETIQKELDSMLVEAAEFKKAGKVPWKDMFTKFEYKWPLFVSVMMMFSQQLSGINVAMFYSGEVFRSANLSPDNANYATVGMGSINVMMTLVSTIMVDRFGRVILHVIGLSGMLISSVLLVVFLTLTIKHDYGWASYMAIVLIFLFVIAFATGPGSIPWFFVSELFSQAARGNANSVAVVANWSANLVVALSFLPLNDAIKQFSFLLFSGFLLIFLVFTLKFVPETKGRSVDDIVQNIFMKGKYK